MDDIKNNIRESVARHWNNHAKRSNLDKPSRWWRSDIVWTHINSNYFGIYSAEKFAFHDFISSKIGVIPGRHGLSIACGEAHKEINLLLKNIVNQFDLYDLSSERLKKAANHAKKAGVFHKINFSSEDILSSPPKEKYDLIYWHAALHHMLDTNQAVEWSEKSLKPGGYLIFNEYVGPNRMQWDDDDLTIVNDLRDSIPQSILEEAQLHGVRIVIKQDRLPIARMIQSDPSEAVDSQNILPSIKQFFPSAQVIPLGGLVYMIGLGDLVMYARSSESISWLKLALSLDKTLAKFGKYYFAAGICQKPL